MKMRAGENTSVLWNTHSGKHLVSSGKVEYLHALQASNSPPSICPEHLFQGTCMRIFRAT